MHVITHQTRVERRSHISATSGKALTGGGKLGSPSKGRLRHTRGAVTAKRVSRHGQFSSLEALRGLGYICLLECVPDT